MKSNRANMIDLHSYDKYIVAYSGGKDSTACFLHLLEEGVPKEKIELWHHDIDGMEKSFMDWAITPGYCKAFAEAFGVDIYYQWKVGGFRREMLRNNTPTASTRFLLPDGEVEEVGGKGPPGTRLKFPQVSANLNVRWCSAYLKIDVCAAAIRNQDRFNHSRTLVISGERAEESAARAKYKAFEPDRSDSRGGKKSRHVDRWRPIKEWPEKMVWEIIERWKVRAHPAYYLGWGRVSCLFCIFGNKNQFCSAYEVSPWQGQEVIQYEKQFDCTIKRDKSVPQLIKEGERYEGTYNEKLMNLARGRLYHQDIFMDKWELPSGAYGESAGPS